MAELTQDQIKHMVDRFLGWKLPEAFCPDAGISFKPLRNEGTPYEAKQEPVGTNLFTAEQAEAMIRYISSDMVLSALDAQGGEPALYQYWHGDYWGWRAESIWNGMQSTVSRALYTHPSPAAVQALREALEELHAKLLQAQENAENAAVEATQKNRTMDKEKFFEGLASGYEESASLLSTLLSAILKEQP